MRKLCLLIALTGSLASYQCYALTVDINRVPGYAEVPGGEFTVVLDSSDAGDPVYASIISHYDASTIVGGGFETFCLSSTTELLGNPQNATLTSSGVAAGTAWLYSQFVNQTLAGYNYTPGAGRVTSAWALQNAIWELQGTSVLDPTAAATYYNLAVTSLGLANALALTGGYSVDALDLTYANPNGGQIVSQPMLAVVPDGGATVMLLGLALGSFCFVSRKMRA
jgi:hypothetical protein